MAMLKQYPVIAYLKDDVDPSAGSQYVHAKTFRNEWRENEFRERMMGRILHTTHAYSKSTAVAMSHELTRWIGGNTPKEVCANLRAYMLKYWGHI